MFVALFPPEEARDHLRRHLPPGAARRADKWHVTLAFLGTVPDDAAPVVTHALDGVPAPGPLHLRLAGGGRFGSVVWVGLRGDVEPLGAFREQIRSALDDAGFPIDGRPFRPHLTITYRYDARILSALDSYVGPSWTADLLTLANSHNGDYHHLWTHPSPIEPPFHAIL
ncbi:RNA 2',3'-cyclic phosphodiesterase [Actinoplanes utahensis]|uniref:RNA 2',3'-cyclic phosphodiesterase n=1 Tax=Actinoplanes utahensis TaxID=1869 RepID=UPI002287187D|nr:RNA 2',3'-cyclic phosphodiesterase [Actinoplanes utahensis]